MEDNLKILKVEYISNHLFDLPQLINLSLKDQIENCCKSRWTTIEDDLKMFKVEYLSSHLFYPPQLLNLNLGDLDLFP